MMNTGIYDEMRAHIYQGLNTGLSMSYIFELVILISPGFLPVWVIFLNCMNDYLDNY